MQVQHWSKTAGQNTRAREEQAKKNDVPWRGRSKLRLFIRGAWIAHSCVIDVEIFGGESGLNIYRSELEWGACGKRWPGLQQGQEGAWRSKSL